MEIERARIYGYCAGVRRAVELALAEASAGAPGGVFTMGPLIHNPQAIERLQDLGVGILEEAGLPESLAGAVVVVRAHGITPGAERELRSRGARVVDATCPRVKASQRKAEAASARGRTVVLAGERTHGEIVGVAAHADRCLIVGNAAEAAEAALALKAAGGGAAPTLLAQTTITEEEYSSIEAPLREAFPDLEAVDSICPATKERQEALAELVGRVDAVVVIGGRNSANTRRLLAIAKEGGKPAWHIETAEELPAEVFGFGRVGLTAGASTPDEVIDQVERRLAAGEAAGTVGN